MVGFGVSIENSYATGNVSGNGDYYVGGLAGVGARIENSYATGNVSGGDYAGGLAGRSSIENSYATGNVSGGDFVGGLVGLGARIENSYATGNVSGSDVVGGLAGSGHIENSYATGNVSGGDYVGGLVGCLYLSGRFENSFAMGSSIIATGRVGGLTGEYLASYGRITNLYRFENLSINGTPIPPGHADSVPNRMHGGALTMDQLTNQAIYESNGWDFDNIWIFKPNVSPFPVLRSFYNPPTSNYLYEATVPIGTPVTLSSDMPGVIRYTTDGTEPTADSEVFSSSSPIVINGPTLIKAKSFRGSVESDTAVFFYDNKVLAPKADPRSGTIFAYDETITITLSSPTPGSTVRYTTDGTEPAAGSPVYTSPIPINASTTVKARASNDGWPDSDTVSFTYAARPRVAAPTSNRPTGSTINGNDRVTLISSSAGAVIMYTTNGTDPSLTNGFIYTSPIRITGPSDTTTIKARAFRSDMAPSFMFEATYRVGAPEVIQLGFGETGIRLPSSVPLLNGKEINLNLGNIRALASYDDDKVMIGIGFGSSDWGINFTQQERRKKFSELKNLVDFVNYINPRNWEYSVKISKPSGGVLGTDFEVIGYLEGALVNGEVTSLSGKILIKGEAQYKDEWQLPINFPVVFGLNLGVSASYTGTVFSTNARNLLPGGHAFNFVIPRVGANAGVGFAKIASVGVYAAADMNLNWNVSNSNTRWTLVGEFGGYVRVLFIKYTLTAHRGTIWDSGVIARSMALAGTNMYDMDNYDFASRDYIQSQSGWLGDRLIRPLGRSGAGTGGINILQESIYPDAAPLIAEAGGSRVMIFLADDGSRDDMNRTKLMYSLYDASTHTWSAPRAIFDDGTADFYPSIASDGDNIWVTWHKSKRSFGNTSSFNDMLAAAEIAVARFDGASGTFESIGVLTDNDVLDTQPVIAVNGGDAFVAWVRNTQNDIFGMNGFDNSIVARQFTNGVWGEPVTLANGLGGVLDMDAAFYGGKFQVAYITDNDNNMETIDDRSLTVMDLSGTVTGTPVNGKFVSKPQFITINGERALSWLEDRGFDDITVNNIRYMTANGPIVTLSNDSSMTTDNYKIFNNVSGDAAVIYPVIEDETGYFMGQLCKDGQLGNPFKLAETGAFARFFDGVWEDNDEFNLVFNNSNMSIIGEGADAELIETNNLCSLRGALPVNIVLNSVFYIDGDISPGQPLPVSLEVENIGAITVNNVDVKVDGATVRTFPISGGLKTGGTTTIDFNLNIPSGMLEQTEFVISVEPNGSIDADMSDNSRAVVLGHSNLMLLLDKRYDDDGAVKVVANIENTSTFDAGAKLYVRNASMNTDIVDLGGQGVIETVNISNIAGRSTLSHVLTFDPKEIVPAGEAGRILHFELVSDKEYANAKSDFVVIFAVEEIPEDPPTSVIGTVSSFHPDIPTTIRLTEGDDVSYTTVIAPVTAPADDTERHTQAFIFRDVQPGSYALEITKAGYENHTSPLEVFEADIMFGEVALVKIAPTVTSVTVTPPAASVYNLNSRKNIVY